MKKYCLIVKDEEGRIVKRYVNLREKGLRRGIIDWLVKGEVELSWYGRTVR